MDLKEFLREKTTYNQINNYLSYRITYKEWLYEDEYSEIIKLYNNLDKIYINDSTLPIKSKIKKLIILSKNDEDEITSNIISENIPITSLSKNETYENIKVLVKSQIENIFDDEIKKLIYKYTSYNISKKTIINLIQDLNQKLKEQITLIIENNYNTDCEEIYEELTKENINIEKLEKTITKFTNRKNECNFCYLNYILVKKTIAKMLDEEIYKKILFKGQYDKIKYQFLQKIYSLMDNTIKSKFIKKDIEEEKIKIKSEYPKEIQKIHTKEIQNPLITDETIITIDDTLTQDLDGAFSIKKLGDMYSLNVFITDVPEFLINNRKIMKEAYKRGTSIYSKTKTKQYAIDMLPKEYAYNVLSLNKNGYKNVIQFNFLFNSNGILQATGVKKATIKISTAYTPQEALKNIKDDMNLILYKELVTKACSQTEEKYLKQINTDSIESINSFSSILVNYYIGHNSQFAIYKNNGIYTRNHEDFYTNSVTPLRKYVSNINLIFFLSQIGIGNYPNKYLYEILDNTNEIINHLNETEIIASYMSSNPKILKKYIK